VCVATVLGLISPDRWAFGVVLYELLTGERPFKGKDSTEIMARAVTSEADLDKAPAKVRRLLGECLKKEPEERLRWAGDVARFLDESSPAVAAPAAVSAHRRSWLWASIAAFIALALMPANILHFREQPPQQQVLQYTLASPEKAGGIQQVAISPDGHYLVMRVVGDAGPKLWVRATDSLQVQLLPGTGNGDYPFWSPDSRYIGFLPMASSRRSR
jgi:serine/threonine protein kinase